MMSEAVIDASSDRVQGTIEQRGELWNRCHDVLMERLQLRLEQEVRRLGGDYAHITKEHIEIRRDDAKNESWLVGRFGYVLYRRRGQVA